MIVEANLEEALLAAGIEVAEKRALQKKYDPLLIESCNQKNEIAKLTEENKKLLAELDAKRAALAEVADAVPDIKSRLSAVDQDAKTEISDLKSDIHKLLRELSHYINGGYRAAVKRYAILCGRDVPLPPLPCDANGVALPTDACLDPVDVPMIAGTIKPHPNDLPSGCTPQPA